MLSEKSRAWLPIMFGVPALLYLTVGPVIYSSVITPSMSFSAQFAVVFGIFLYLQFRAVGIHLAYDSAAQLYGFKRRILLPPVYRLLLSSTE